MIYGVEGFEGFVFVCVCIYIYMSFLLLFFFFGGGCLGFRSRFRA